MGGMSRYTALLIKGARKKDLEVMSAKDEGTGKWAVALWLTDYSPSGCPRPRLLLDSGPVFDSKEASESDMWGIIKQIRAMSEKKITGG